MAMKTTVGIIAPSAVVPPVEFTLGADRLREAGFTVFVHPQVGKQHLFFAGTDQERAEALYDFASDSRIQVLWAARGGYGSARILAHLEKLTAERGIPDHKLYVGYSDSTAVMEYVRNRWGWSTMHAPMPATRNFTLLPARDWKALVRLAKGKAVAKPFGPKKLQFFGEAPKKPIRGPLVGGNLAVWASLVGTPYAPRARDKILFFEDISEGLYRIDRMVQQLEASGGFERVKAIVLGEFHDCTDSVPKVLASMPPLKGRAKALKDPAPEELEPLRQSMPQRKGLEEIFRPIMEAYRVPVAYGLPVGHGRGTAPLPLGGDYRLTPQGALELVRWDWARR